MYENLIEMRTKDIEGISSWHWIKGETGAWVGPHHDWTRSHKEKFFKYLRNRDVVVCAGGNQGMYPRLFAREFKFVYTFEPDPLNFCVLNMNCQDENIIKFQAALGESSATIALLRNNMVNTGMHKVDGDGMIPQLPLDSFRLPALDLLQLDVEGYELHVLKGAIEHINRYRPVITCENANEQINTFLTNLGYLPVDQSVSDTVFVSQHADS